MSDALEKGIAIEKANMFGDPRRKAEAIEYFKQALLENPREIQAWGGIVAMTDNDNSTKKYCLRKMLEIDPHNEGAKIMLDFILETEPNFKWLKEEVSPIQIFFESQQRAQPPFMASQSYRPTAPNVRGGVTPQQNSRPSNIPQQRRTVSRPISPPKKRGNVLSWIFLVLTLLLVCFVIVIIALLLPYRDLILSILNGSQPLTPETIDSLARENPVLTLILYGIGSLGALGFEIIYLGAMAAWVISGFVGAFQLFKKGWGLELLGCVLIAGGTPILFPVMFGPLIYWIGKVAKEKHSEKKIAYIICPYCASPVPSTVPYCPHCGKQIRR